jgi:hypothetical protein
MKHMFGEGLEEEVPFPPPATPCGLLRVVAGVAPKWGGGKEVCCPPQLQVWCVGGRLDPSPPALPKPLPSE